MSPEALLGVIGIRDIWVKNCRDTGYLGKKLKAYRIFKKKILRYGRSKFSFFKRIK